MSPTLRDCQARPDLKGLSDLVTEFGDPEYLPPTDWMTILRLERPRKDIRSLDGSTRLMKRAVDVLVSTTMLVLLIPVMALVALAVRLTSPGPAIYRQERVGLNLRQRHRDRRSASSSASAVGSLPERRSRTSDRRRACAYGRPFLLYKFRTMTIDAERDGARFAVAGDPRLTPIGGFLRRTRLDELPQLWNVLKGEMSLVGPRPERPVFIEQLSDEIPDYLQRLGLKPGLTGLAQIVNGYDNEIEGFRRKVALDLLYLQNCCVWNDLKILTRTIAVVLCGKGAI